MKHFQSIEAIRNAQVEEIAQVEGMNENVAVNVYKFFHED